MFLIVAPDITIISGHQRLKACRELGYKTVPVIIQEDVDDEDGKLRKLIAANFGGVRQGSAGKVSLGGHNVPPMSQGDIAKPKNAVLNQTQLVK